MGEKSALNSEAEHHTQDMKKKQSYACHQE